MQKNVAANSRRRARHQPAIIAAGERQSGDHSAGVQMERLEGGLVDLPAMSSVLPILVFSPLLKWNRSRPTKAWKTGEPMTSNRRRTQRSNEKHV